MNVVPLTAPEAQALEKQIENLWATLVAEAAPNIAFVAQFTKDATPEEVAKLFGPDTIDRARLFLEDFRKMYAAVKQLQAGTAVLVPWREGPEPVISLAIVQRSALPPGTTLAVWPIVALAFATTFTIAAAAVLWKSFDLDVQRLRGDNEKLKTQAIERMQQNAAAMQKTDPALAQKMADIALRASAASTTATQSPSDWLNKFFGGFGAIGEAVPVVAVIAFLLWAFERTRGRRRAA